MGSIKVTPQMVETLVGVVISISDVVSRRREDAALDRQQVRKLLLARLEESGDLETPDEIRARVRAEAGLPPESGGHHVLRNVAEAAQDGAGGAKSDGAGVGQGSPGGEGEGGEP